MQRYKNNIPKIISTVNTERLCGNLRFRKFGERKAKAK